MTPADQPAKRPRTHSRSGNPAKASGRVEAAKPVGPATAADWISGARLRTLPLAIAPVALGTGAGVLAIAEGPWHPARALLALVVALALQIGVNYANDYSDGVRGTDDHRVGPARLTGSGAAKPKHVLAVALAFFAIAALAGLALVVVTQQWWLLAIGAVAIVAAWFYTGGKHPYGYYGLGELFVFVFFGLVATAGSAYVQALTVNLEAWLGGVGTGLLACAVLMANNLRDVAQDKLAGKRTLAVLVGERAGRVLFVVFALVPFAIAGFLAIFYPTAWLVQFALLALLPACLIVLTAKTPRELITALQLTSLTALVYGVGLGLVLAF
ncbi:1,4-dihydroxy-2-naphthoate polyprenyltransferase [Agromyces sp. H3Y2-19a]|uniref:1,4-dihydroxy-2-naphthoate polyprenyltransferase n=1 Tax=Agromyces TaxID=33877 RepID=UPI001E46B32F|nr:MULTISPECIES: 1,4-dihydroxy-2-naphthoate polyprenyltransferase [Agromyces]MCD5344970.1 1,4-dihydroxy-2-naphthoate polyprenyltransferase [Agromyces sp. S2-1-8]MDF0513851.1 1,4-dihydroxy-2-naphthoate polyprenyltransferase [Agromyces chromiiresistens]